VQSTGDVVGEAQAGGLVGAGGVLDLGHPVEDLIGRADGHEGRLYRGPGAAVAWRGRLEMPGDRVAGGATAVESDVLVVIERCAGRGLLDLGGIAGVDEVRDFLNRPAWGCQRRAAVGVCAARRHVIRGGKCAPGREQEKRRKKCGEVLHHWSSLL
jgi:hypothetical protein